MVSSGSPLRPYFRAIVPLSIARSRYVMRKGRLMTCPGDVTLTVHPPIPTVDVTREQARELAERVRAVVRSAVDEPEPQRPKPTDGTPVQGPEPRVPSPESRVPSPESRYNS